MKTNTKEKSVIIIIFCCLLSVILLTGLIVGGYLLYAYMSYYRIEDNIPLEIVTGTGVSDVDSEGVDSSDNNLSGTNLSGTNSSGTNSSGEKILSPGEEYTVASYNIGFGAYSREFSFFMDGGVSAVAESPESVVNLTKGAASLLDEYSPDFILFQEVDVDGTRSRHINQVALLQEHFATSDSVFCQNFDSFFIAVPLTEPHGANKGGMLTFSSYSIAQSYRLSLPVDECFSKFFDLDRCLSVARIPVSDGKELVLINAHLSAYSTVDEIREGQLSLIRNLMGSEVAAGNYVILGGDLNHNLKEQDSSATSEYSWCYPYPRESLAEGCYFPIDTLLNVERAALHNSCRNANESYNPNTSFTVTVDGFIVSDNVKTIRYEQVDTEYEYSDHDPVLLTFELAE